MDLKKIKTKKEVSYRDKCDGYLIDASEKEVRGIVMSLEGSGKKIFVVGRDDVFNRRVLETIKIDYLVSVEGGVRRDSLKQRDSGFNHVMARIAKEKGIGIVIDFEEVVKLKGKERALRLGRIMQNVRVCRRVGCGIKILGGDERVLKSFGFSLGMGTGQVAGVGF